MNDGPAAAALAKLLTPQSAAATGTADIKAGRGVLS